MLICSSHEKFWLTSENGSFHRRNSDFHSYLPCRQQVVTSNTGPILVFPRIQPFGSDVSSSLGNVYTRQGTASVNCENSAVFFVMKFCSISTVVWNPPSVKKLLNLCCCDNFAIRSPYHCNSNSLCAGSSLFKSTFVLIHLAQTRKSTVFSQRVSPFYRDMIHILHVFLRLARKDWADLQK